MKLIMTVGLPRSGKSTWALKHSLENGIPVVNPDAVRMAIHGTAFDAAREPEVWRMVRMMVRHNLHYGYEWCVLDATNINKANRDVFSEYERYFRVFDTPREECIARVTRGGQQYLIPTINRMAARFSIPTEDEGKFYVA